METPEHASPKIQLAVCTHLTSVDKSIVEIADACGVNGIDFAVTYKNIDNLKQAVLDCCGPGNRFELRYHAYFADIEIGNTDSDKAKQSLEFMNFVARTVAEENGRFLTIHLGFDSNLPEGAKLDSAIIGLKSLASGAADLGVTICVENLRRGLTAQPKDFIRLVEESSAAVTFDVGHFISSEAGSGGYHVEDMIARLGNRIAAAHIYEAEIDGIGHVAPVDLSTIKTALDALSRTACDWWVAELGDPVEICRTIGLLRDYRKQSVS